MATSKVMYRNSAGCCICRTKSSSSRFTNSRRYENTFEACFLVSSKERSGWICNSCVLIVKRFRKNPHKMSGIKNWSHKIDSRVGPGSKPKPFRKSSALDHSPSSSSSRGSHRSGSDGKAIYASKYSRGSYANSSARGPIKAAVQKQSTNRSFMLDSDDDECTWKIMRVKRKAYQAKRFKPRHGPQEPWSYIDREYYSRLVQCCGEEYIGRNRDILATIQPSRPCHQSPCPLWSSLLAVCSSLRSAEASAQQSTYSSSSSSVPASRGSSVVIPSYTSSGTSSTVLSEISSSCLSSASPPSAVQASWPDQTTLLLTKVSECLSGLDQCEEEGYSSVLLVGKCEEMHDCMESCESSGIVSRATSDPGDTSPLSVQSRISDEDY